MEMNTAVKSALSVIAYMREIICKHYKVTCIMRYACIQEKVARKKHHAEKLRISLHVCKKSLHVCDRMQTFFCIYMQTPAHYFSHTVDPPQGRTVFVLT